MGGETDTAQTPPHADNDRRPTIVLSLGARASSTSPPSFAEATACPPAAASSAVASLPLAQESTIEAPEGPAAGDVANAAPSSTRCDHATANQPLDGNTVTAPVPAPRGALSRGCTQFLCRARRLSGALQGRSLARFIAFTAVLVLFAIAASSCDDDEHTPAPHSAPGVSTNSQPTDPSPQHAWSQSLSRLQRALAAQTRTIHELAANVARERHERAKSEHRWADRLRGVERAAAAAVQRANEAARLVSAAATDAHGSDALAQRPDLAASIARGAATAARAAVEAQDAAAVATSAAHASMQSARSALTTRDESSEGEAATGASCAHPFRLHECRADEVTLAARVATLSQRALETARVVYLLEADEAHATGNVDAAHAASKLVSLVSAELDARVKARRRTAESPVGAPASHDHKSKDARREFDLVRTKQEAGGNVDSKNPERSKLTLAQSDAEARRKATRERREANEVMQKEAPRDARLEAQRDARLEAQRDARLEAQRKAQREAQREAELEAQREAQREAELEAQRKAQREAQREAQLRAERKAKFDARREASYATKCERGASHGDCDSSNADTPRIDWNRLARKLGKRAWNAATTGFEKKRNEILSFIDTLDD